MTAYKLSPAWRIDRAGDGWEIYGGDDARFAVADSPLVRQLLAGAVSKSDVDEADGDLFVKLLSAEIICPQISPKSPSTIQIIGDKLPFELAPDIKLTDEPKRADLQVVVRHASTQNDIRKQVADLSRPHLYIDISFHHTISTGPLVIPHETPCILCLYGRLNQRWGERPPSPEPEVSQRYAELTRALIYQEIDRALSGDTSLVGRTVAWDWAGRRTMSEKLLTVPLCTYCEIPAKSGIIDL